MYKSHDIIKSYKRNYILNQLKNWKLFNSQKLSLRKGRLNVLILPQIFARLDPDSVHQKSCGYRAMII